MYNLRPFLLFIWLVLALGSCDELLETAIDQEATYISLTPTDVPPSVLTHIQSNYPNFFTSCLYKKEVNHTYSYKVILREMKEHKMHKPLSLTFDKEGLCLGANYISHSDIIDCFEYPIQLRLRYETTFRSCPDQYNLSAIRVQTEDYGYEYKYPIYYTIDRNQLQILNFEALKEAYKVNDYDIFSE